MFPERVSKVPVIYSESYYVEIGDHVFPTSKYRLLKKRLDSDPALMSRFVLTSPVAATDEEVLTTHTPGYVMKLKTGTLTQEEVLMMELPSIGAALLLFQESIRHPSGITGSKMCEGSWPL